MDPTDPSLQTMAFVAKAVPGTQLVQVDLSDPDPAKVGRVGRAVASGFLARQKAIFARVQAANEAATTRYSKLLSDLEQLPNVPPAHLPLLSSPSVLPKGKWGLIVEVEGRLEGYQERNLPPRASQTRMVAGPDVRAERRGPRIAAAVLLGLVLGLFLAIGLTGGLELVANDPHSAS